MSDHFFRDIVPPGYEFQFAAEPIIKEPEEPLPESAVEEFRQEVQKLFGITPVSQQLLEDSQMDLEHFYRYGPRKIPRVQMMRNRWYEARLRAGKLMYKLITGEDVPELESDWW